MKCMFKNIKRMKMEQKSSSTVKRKGERETGWKIECNGSRPPPPPSTRQTTPATITTTAGRCFRMTKSLFSQTICIYLSDTFALCRIRWICRAV